MGRGGGLSKQQTIPCDYSDGVISSVARTGMLKERILRNISVKFSKMGGIIQLRNLEFAFSGRDGRAS